MDQGLPQRIFFALGSVFVTCLVVSDIIGGAKLVELGTVYGRHVTVSVGMIAFPLTFVLTDVLNEFYGAKAVRFMTYVGLLMLLLTYGILSASTSLRAASYTPYPP
ncbi:MAG: VUT family protein, partial [Myxococcales bacterium]